MRPEHNTNNLRRDVHLDPVADRAPRIARGVARLLRQHGFATIGELKLPSHRRADVAGLDRANTIVMVEIKSGLADLRADTKWPDYRDHCDLFYFAVDDAFPRDALPDGCGIIVADAFGAAIVRDAPEHRLSAARRKAVTVRFAMQAAHRAPM